MAKASRCYTGGRQSVGTPTLNRENYMFMMKIIRKEMEKRNAENKIRQAAIPADQPASCGNS